MKARGQKKPYRPIVCSLCYEQGHRPSLCHNEQEMSASLSPEAFAARRLADLPPGGYMTSTALFADYEEAGGYVGFSRFYERLRGAVTRGEIASKIGRGYCLATSPGPPVQSATDPGINMDEGRIEPETPEPGEQPSSVAAQDLGVQLGG